MSNVGQANIFSDASEYNTLNFVIARATEKMQTVSIVQVKAVDTIKLTVDVQVLVNLVTGANVSIPHAVIFGRPYYRAQGGTSGIILDPVVGDIGIMVFASRDSSAVISAKGLANPGSQRRFSWSDGIYFGGILNVSPAQYLKFAAGGITLHSPTAITLDAPASTITGTADVTGATTLHATLAVTGTSTLTGAVMAPGGITTTTIAGASAVFTGSVTASSFIGGGGGGGSVTSVGISTAGVGVVVGGGPITTAGTLTVDLSSSAYAALALAVTALQTVSVQDSITGNGTSGSKLQLVNDSASPGANMAYSTDGSGVKGWHASGGTPTPVPATIPDMFYWLQGDTYNISAASRAFNLANSCPFNPAWAQPVNAPGVTCAAAQLNSKNVLQWPGNNTGRYKLQSPGILPEVSVFVVYYQPTTTYANWLTGPSGAFQITIDSSTGKFASVQSAIAVIGESTTAVPTAAWTQFNTTYSQSSGAWAFRISQAAAGSGTNSLAITANSDSIGWDDASGTQDMTGRVAEMIVYSRALTLVEVQAVEAYLFAKWGV
jgi:hypothetical protein